MADRVSKTNANQLAFSADVRAVFQVSGKSIAQKAEAELYAKKRKRKRKRLDLVEITEEMHDLLDDAEKDLRSAAEAHADELADDDPIRADRDDAKAALGADLLSARSIVTGMFGARFAKRVGLDRPLEDRPDLLSKLGGSAARLLRKAQRPASWFGAAKLDLTEVADTLDEKVERLSSLLSSLKREEREAEQSMIARDHAVAYWRTIITLAAGWLENLARIAGEYEIADRVRPTERRQAGIADAEETEVLATDTEGTGGDDATDRADPEATDTGGTDPEAT